ncbi:leucine-rich repeat domain-containing protein [Enterococcus sp. AZ163]|uniref:leucine-rich repeat domain-containing protein n=1 Tax=Enterococcus sp. AZ163 TaxID=2774638 RepID=UPI003D27ECE2
MKKRLIILSGLCLIILSGCGKEEKSAASKNSYSVQSVSKESYQETTEDTRQVVEDSIAREQEKEAKKKEKEQKSSEGQVMTYSETDEGMIVSVYLGEKKDVKIPKMVRGKPVIGINGSFKGQSRIRSVEIPETVRFIGKESFMYCDNLETVTIKGEGLEEIDEWAFYYCESLKKINLPDTVTKIEMVAFEGCQALQEIKLPANMKEVGEGIFGETGLEKVDIPDGVTKIHNMAFYKCTSLEEVTIPESVTDIHGGSNGSFIDSPNVTIVTPKGSYAETYAKEEGIPVKH